MKCPDPYLLMIPTFAVLALALIRPYGCQKLVLSAMKHILYKEEGFLWFVLSTLLQYMHLRYYDAMSIVSVKMSKNKNCLEIPFS